jgi:hypothetical protein
MPQRRMGEWSAALTTSIHRTGGWVGATPDLDNTQSTALRFLSHPDGLWPVTFLASHLHAWEPQSEVDPLIKFEAD